MKDSPKSICCAVSSAFWCVTIVFVILRYTTQNDQAGELALVLGCLGFLTCAIMVAVPDTLDIRRSPKVRPIDVRQSPKVRPIDV